MEDARLVHALRARQDGAMERFHTAYGPLIGYIIAPILADERDREECLSDALLRVWDSIGTFDPGRAALTTWLTHLARNAALNRRRPNRRRIGPDRSSRRGQAIPHPQTFAVGTGRCFGWMELNACSMRAVIDSRRSWLD